MSAPLAGQIGEMARRSIIQTLRQPAQIVPPLTFPLLLLAVNVGGLEAATRLPGFPAESYLDFAIAIAFVQAAMFAMVNAGTSLSRDVQTGFLKRLALTPMQRAALLLGNLAGVMVVSLVSAGVYLVVGFAAGMELEAGPLGAVVLVALALLATLGFAAVGAAIGLRAGNGEAVQGFFPVFFVLLFLSSMLLPRPLIEQDWFRTIATVNPVSYLIEGLRSLVISGWDGEALALGFGVAVAILVAGTVAAQRILRTRLLRT